MDKDKSKPFGLSAGKAAVSAGKEAQRVASPIAASGGDGFGAGNLGGGKWGGKMPLIVGGGLAAVVVLVLLFGGRRCLLYTSDAADD